MTLSMAARTSGVPLSMTVCSVSALTFISNRLPSGLGTRNCPSCFRLASLITSGYWPLGLAIRRWERARLSREDSLAFRSDEISSLEAAAKSRSCCDITIQHRCPIPLQL